MNHDAQFEIEPFFYAEFGSPAEGEWLNLEAGYGLQSEIEQAPLFGGVLSSLASSAGLASALRLGRENLALRIALLRGERDENKLTNLLFFARHPEWQGRKLRRGEPNFEQLSREWLDIRDRLVRPALRAAPSRGASPAAPAAAAPALGGAKAPSGFRMVKRKGVERGLARYGGDRVDWALLALRSQGRISVTNEDIDTFQRIANVETSGLVQGINTWDSAVVSIGFMQWTLQFGELQAWIQKAPAAFRRYGIELNGQRTYTWNSGKQPAIRGAATKDELRWNGWAERFYQAGLDSEIIAAEVELAVLKLQQHLDGLRRRLRAAKRLDDFTVFKSHYDRSPPIRGLFQEAYNNLPAAALSGTMNALRRAREAGGVSSDRFLEILQDGIRKAYLARNDNGENVIVKTLAGARFQ